MMQMDTYIFTELEFSILAAAKGMKKVYGIVFEDQTPVDSKEIYLTMHGMVKKGYMTASEQEFILDPQIHMIYDAIQESARLLLISRRNDVHSQKCCYPGSSCIIVAQPGVQDKNAVKISVISREDFDEYLSEEGSFLLSNVVESILGEKDDPYERKDITYTEEEIYADYKLIDANQDVTLAHMIILQRGLEDLICCSGLFREGEVLFRYSRQRVIEEVNKMLEVYCYDFS